MPADPRVSLGARLERKTMAARLRRRVKAFKGPESYLGAILQVEVDWLLRRQQRYDKKPGGLGK